MEHLQRQQEAKLEMNLQEKHLLQAQLLFAQHAAAAARASGSRLDSALFGHPDGQMYPSGQPALKSHLSKADPDEEDEDSEEEGQGVADPEEQDEVEDDDDDEEDEEEGSPHQLAKKPRFQSVAGFPFPPYSAPQLSAVKQKAESPPSVIKQEQEEKELQSPAGQQAFTSPNGFCDWGYDEPFKQVRGLFLPFYGGLLHFFSHYKLIKSPFATHLSACGYSSMIPASNGVETNICGFHF